MKSHGQLKIYLLIIPLFYGIEIIHGQRNGLRMNGKIF